MCASHLEILHFAGDGFELVFHVAEIAHDALEEIHGEVEPLANLSSFVGFGATGFLDAIDLGLDAVAVFFQGGDLAVGVIRCENGDFAKGIDDGEHAAFGTHELYFALQTFSGEADGGFGVRSELVDRFFVSRLEVALEKPGVAMAPGVEIGAWIVRQGIGVFFLNFLAVISQIREEFVVRDGDTLAFF